jgi:hypothetical protein
LTQEDKRKKETGGKREEGGRRAIETGIQKGKNLRWQQEGKGRKRLEGKIKRETGRQKEEVRKAKGRVRQEGQGRRRQEGEIGRLIGCCWCF